MMYPHTILYVAKSTSNFSIFLKHVEEGFVGLDKVRTTSLTIKAVSAIRMKFLVICNLFKNYILYYEFCIISILPIKRRKHFLFLITIKNVHTAIFCTSKLSSESLSNEKLLRINISIGIFEANFIWFIASTTGISNI